MVDPTTGVGPARRGTLSPGVEAWLITRHEEVSTALTDPRLVLSAPDVQADLVRRGELPQRFATLFQRRRKTLLSTDPPDHTRLRKLVNGSFTARRIETLRARAQEICDELIAGMAAAAGAGQVVDLIDSFAFPLPTIMICELLGVPVEDRGKFRDWSHAIVFDQGDEASVAAYGRAMAGLDEYFAGLIQVKRTSPGDDLVSELITAYSEDGQLDTAELRGMLSLLLVAGHETTANLIANSVLLLIRCPDQLATLRSDPELLPAAIEECLRHVGPVAFSSIRFTTEDVQVGEVTIPAGEIAAMGLWAASHDSRKYPDPHAFDINRQAGPHLAFGRGAHFCVGANLARMEAHVALGALLRQFERFALAVPEEDLQWRPANTRGPQRLPLRLTPTHGLDTSG